MVLDFPRPPCAPKYEEGVAEPSRHHLDVVGQELLSLLQGGRTGEFGDLFRLDVVHPFLTFPCVFVSSDVLRSGVPLDVGVGTGCENLLHDAIPSDGP